MASDRIYQCQRCGASIDHSEDHTKIVRRDFHGETEPSTTEYLCQECLDDYVTGFLDDETFS